MPLLKTNVDKRNNLRNLIVLKKKTDADTAIAALIKEHSADVSEAIINNIIKTYETHKNNLMRAENEPDRN